MKLRICQPKLKDFNELSSMIWKSFYFAEKQNLSMNGMEHFRDLTTVAQLQYEFLTKSTTFLCAYDETTPVGIVATRDDHIILLFVACEYQHQGIGRCLLRAKYKNKTKGIISVNSGLSAVSFYERLGFVACGEIINEEELLFLPMRVDGSIFQKKINENTLPC